MKEYNVSHLVKSEDLNHHGTLYAWRSAEWLVEGAFVAAAADFFLTKRRPPISTRVRSSAASDVYKRQILASPGVTRRQQASATASASRSVSTLSLIHISEPTRLLSISYAVFCLKKK